MLEFRFRSLLELRRGERDVAMSELAAAIANLEELVRRRQTIDAARQAALRDPSLTRVGRLQIRSLLDQQRYHQQLTDAHDRAIDEEVTASAVVQRCQAAVREATTEVRRLELLAEKDLAASMMRRAKAEQAAIDEVAARISLSNVSQLRDSMSGVKR